MVFDQGDKVILADDPVHVGTVERPQGERTYIRWHRGYATWECTKDVLPVNPENTP